MTAPPPPAEARPGINWIDAAKTKKCMWPGCDVEFGVFTWQHRCYSCGSVLCAAHGDQRKAVIPGSSSSSSTKQQKVCFGCFGLMSNIKDVPLQYFFLSLLGCYSLGPGDLVKLKLIKTMPDDFSAFSDERWKHLTQTPDFSPLSSVLGIGHYFLANASLTTFDMKPFSNISSLGKNFLFGTNVTSVANLSALSKISRISSGFCSSCRSLRLIDFSGLANNNNIVIIDSWFLAECTALTSVDLSVFTKVKKVDDYFLTGCTSLQSVDTSAFKNMTFLSRKFLSGLANLTSVNLSGLVNVKNLNTGFLAECPKLSQKRYLSEVDLTSLFHLADDQEVFNRSAQMKLGRELKHQRFEQALRSVMLVVYKSPLRISKKLFLKEWLPLRLLFLFAVPNAK